ncbi:primosomal protein N' [Lujinxingia litoralis]|uniref:Replication restart protein PriA n=1 Tax=Lujinxingia litoralis TaxID=2211119 RepID=A0A328C673_9DELT|nr:primosomal protein N' [Lujinxingia litoralis]RAL22736.1 primosomal protein N' [Lujinxingia litoralis]
MTSSSPLYAQVALDVPLFTALSYRVPEHLRDHIAPGQLVQVPFRNRSKTGLIVALSTELDDPTLAPKIRDLYDLVDPEPLLSPHDVRFLSFVADYYLSPIGEVVRLAIPSAVRVEGIKHYRRLPEDQRTPAPNAPQTPLSLELAGALASLSDTEPTPVAALRESHAELTYHRLAELELRGLVEVTYQESASLKPKTERYFKLLPRPRGTLTGRLGANQLQILKLLDGMPSLSLPEIREHIASPYSSLKALEERGLIESWEEEVYRDPFADAPVEPAPSFELTLPQQRAVDAVARARQAGRFEGFVLHGVTGSGKTETYVRIIRDTLAAGRRALVLLPEIALTPQFVGVFRSHFGERIAVLHSGLTAAQKFDQWRQIRRDEVDIVIGARSALFAPINDLGVIVVDEEHDPSFKQEEGTRYNARDMALVRGKLARAQVILGSATPILESFYNARQGRLTYLAMPERVAARALPPVDIVDMRRGPHNPTAGPSSLLSTRLLGALDDTLHDQKQAILFLNRRGFSPCVVCEACGHVFHCPHCDVSLTYHRRMEALRCHHCDFSLRMPESCPECLHTGIDRKGVGTEQLEAHLRELYPRARVARLDRDTGAGPRLQQLLTSFRRREIDILVGTQMVTKGHDFPDVTLVGVVLADMSLNFPDFRAAERTFQLLTQVAGRAGRADSPGKVIIQTYTPEHYSLLTAREHDFESFAERELAQRQAMGYPPFGHLIALKFEGANEGATVQATRNYATAARRLLRTERAFGDAVSMLGPAMAPIARIKNRSRWQLLLKAADRALLRRFTIRTLELAGHFDAGQPHHRNVRIIIDVDPLNML